MTNSSLRPKPVWERGRVGRFAGGLADYARTAWWGFVGGHVTESTPLEIAQAVILRPHAAPGDGDARDLLLSIRSDLFGWELPGGTVEPGEDPIDALVREVREETGFEVVVESHVGDWIRTGFRPHTAHVYRARVVGGQLRSSSETPRVSWFREARLPVALFPWYVEPIARSLEGGPPIDVSERQGIAWILQAMRIDLGMRWRGLPVRSDTSGVSSE